jgi:hypothetical protein
MLFFVTALGLICSNASAQVVELGGGLSRGCPGDSSGFCGDDRGAMWAVHTTVWFDDRLEAGIRFGVLPLPDYTHAVAHDSRFDVVDDPAIRELPRVDVAVRDRSRRIFSGEAIYHFARGRIVRPMLGIGLGDMSNRFDQACAPAGCERLMPTLSSPVGKQATHIHNVTIVAGLSTRIHDKLQLRGGVRLHNFAGEETSTSELFIASGIRFALR